MLDTLNFFPPLIKDPAFHSVTIFDHFGKKEYLVCDERLPLAIVVGYVGVVKILIQHSCPIVFYELTLY